MAGTVYYLAGDIGGTNSRLQLFRKEPKPDGILSPSEVTSSSSSANPTSVFGSDETLILERVYPSQKYASLSFVIEKFLKEVLAEKGDVQDSTGVEKDFHPVACCLAVAGPVRANKATITNVNWVLDGAEMAEQLKIKDVLIINDFVGIGYGLLALERKDVLPINNVPLAAEAPKACIGAGTGLGEVYLTAGHLSTTVAGGASDDNAESDAEYNVWASEGGHADFAPRDSVEFGLMEFFKTNERVARVSVERIVSGLGIPKIYEYFSHLHPEEVNPDVTARLLHDDPGKVIAEFAENGTCSLCRQTIELFVRCYGAECGNMALKTLPFGGMYVAGGIAAKLQHFMLRDNLFWKNFVMKGRMQPLLEKVPLFIVTNPLVGLLGARVVCRRLLRKVGFLPGRGDLASFCEATPQQAFTFGESFSYPDMNESNQFETEVTLDTATKQPEKVIIRRSRKKDVKEVDHQTNVNTGGTATALDDLKRTALKFGALGGVLASAVSVATILAISYWNASTTKRTKTATVSYQ